MFEAERLKRDWNALAKQNARYHIATAAWETEEEFDRSGARDTALFFGGLEHLLLAGTVALDLGCGIGRMDRHVAARVGRLVGIDISGEMVRLARERLADLRNVEFVEGDGSSLRPLPDAEFDLVFSYIVFQHVPDAIFLGYLRECARVLKRGGHFVFQFAETSTPVAHDPAAGSFVTRFHTEAGVRLDLAKAGFEVRSAVRKTIETEHMPCDFVRLHAVKV